VLDGVTAWMQVNSEAIYETRPWKVYGEGPNTVKAGSFQGDSIRRVGAKDIRFTRNKANNLIYAFMLGWPAAPAVIQSLGLSAPTQPGKIVKVELLGTDATVKWKQLPESLQVELPADYKPPVDFAAALKVTLA